MELLSLCTEKVRTSMRHVRLHRFQRNALESLPQLPDIRLGHLLSESLFSFVLSPTFYFLFPRGNDEGTIWHRVKVTNLLGVVLGRSGF